MRLEDFAKRKPWPEPSLMLTEGEIDALLAAHGKGDDGFHSFARAIERTVAQRIVTRLEAACGATSLPPDTLKQAHEAWRLTLPSRSVLDSESAAFVAGYKAVIHTSGSPKPLCTACWGEGWEPSVYDGRRPCGHCVPQAVQS